MLQPMLIAKLAVDKDSPIKTLHAVEEIDPDDITSSPVLERFLQENQHVKFVKGETVETVLSKARQDAFAMRKGKPRGAVRTGG